MRPRTVSTARTRSGSFTTARPRTVCRKRPANPAARRAITSKTEPVGASRARFVRALAALKPPARSPIIAGLIRETLERRGIKPDDPRFGQAYREQSDALSLEIARAIAARRRKR